VKLRIATAQLTKDLSYMFLSWNLSFSLKTWDGVGLGTTHTVACGDGQTKARLHPTSEREFGEALILCGSNCSTNAGAACRAFARTVNSHHLSCCLRCNSLVSSIEHWAESIGTEVQYRVLHHKYRTVA
jgi:hypothetical protein